MSSARALGLRLVHDPAPVLHTRCEPVRVFDAELRRLVREMYERCVEWHGVGLAATQVGLNRQIAVVVHEGHRFAMCNPEIVATSGEVDAVEGCLSLPHRAGLVRRAETVALHYRNAQGRGIQRSLSGWLARIVQHEADHLLGILCPERLAPGAVFGAIPEDGDGASLAEGAEPAGPSPDHAIPAEAGRLPAARGPGAAGRRRASR
ncbi:MAG TPA: peptide deformylase [Candidatus Micrarchaeia archaeon]|nr:peptide deformylase [Candidatus Micrarchaeia archaeon]